MPEATVKLVGNAIGYESPLISETRILLSHRTDDLNARLQRGRHIKATEAYISPEEKEKIRLKNSMEKRAESQAVYKERLTSEEKQLAVTTLKKAINTAFENILNDLAAAGGGKDINQYPKLKDLKNKIVTLGIDGINKDTQTDRGFIQRVKSIADMSVFINNTPIPSYKDWKLIGECKNAYPAAHIDKHLDLKAIFGKAIVAVCEHKKIPVYMKSASQEKIR